MDLCCLLEELFVLDWPFEFWDHQYKVRNCTKLARLNNVGNQVYVMPITNVSTDCVKHRHVEAFATIFNEPSHTPIDDILNLTCHEEHVPPHAASKVSSDISECNDVEHMKSTPLLKEILENAQRLCPKSNPNSSQLHWMIICGFLSHGIGVSSPL